MTNKYYDLAKDAGNKLRAYILSLASGATGVYVIALSGNEIQNFTTHEKQVLLAAIVFFAITVVICLVELSIDAQRFFHLAQAENGKKVGKKKASASRKKFQSYQRIRVKLIYSSYVTALAGVVTTTYFLVQRLI